MAGSRSAKEKAAAQKAAYAKAMAEMRARHTCRQETGEIGGAGECLRCDAEQGEACRQPGSRGRP